MRSDSTDGRRDTYAIFSALFLPSVGGVENYTNNLAAELARKGDRVVVVTSQLGSDPAHEMLASGVEVVRLPSRIMLGGRLPLPRHGKEYRKLIEGLKLLDIDNVIVNTRFYLHSLEGLRFAERIGVKPILIEHGSAHLTMGNRLLDKVVSAYEHFVTRLTQSHHPDYYAVSQKSAEWLTHFGITCKGVISNAIDADAFRRTSSGRDFRSELKFRSDDFVVAFVGRLVPEKGVSAILESASNLKREDSIRFVIAGTGPMESELAQYKGDNLSFVGKLDRGDVSAMLSQSDAFCLPSRSEGFATSLLECAAWGVVPIVTRVGGVDELIPSDDYGLVIDEPSGSLLADAIRRLASDSEVARGMGRRIRNLVELEFTWRKTAARLRKAFDASAPTGC